MESDLVSVRPSMRQYGLGIPNPSSPYAIDPMAQILAIVNARLAQAGIASPFADAGGFNTPSRMPHADSPAERAASRGGREHEPIGRGGWMAALMRLRQQSGGRDGRDRDSNTERMMREAARRGGGRSRSNASGGTFTHGNIGPNTRMRVSVSGGRAYDRG